MGKEKTIFEELYSIDVNSKTEKKNGLTYLSWAYAWAEFKKKNQEASYKILRFGDNQLPYVYDDNTGYMVFTEVTVGELTHEMWLPVMDGANKAMKSSKYSYFVKDWNESRKQGKDVMIEKFVLPATMFDINKTIMRCLTKNLAMFGLGLYIYAGEDLPEETEEMKEEKAKKTEEDKKLWIEIKEICNELSPKPMENKDMMLAFIKTKTDSKDPVEVKKVLEGLLDKKINENT